MSLAMYLYYTGKDGNARRFAEEMVTSGLVQRIRAEEGNLRYSYYFPMEEPETVLLIDEWADQAALDRHHALPLMAEIATLRDKYDLHMRAERYRMEAQETDADSAFLRK